jgi:hypothetical protein
MSDTNPRRLRPRRQAPKQSELPPSDIESVQYSDDDHEDADRTFRQEPSRQREDPLHFPAPEATGADNSHANRRPILNVDRSNRSDVFNLSPIRDSVPL